MDRRQVIVLVALVVASVGCNPANSSKAGPDHAAVGAAIIKVGPSPNNVSPETQTLNYSAGDVAVWIAVDANGNLDPSVNLFIDFADGQVFDGQTPTPANSSRYRVQCSGWICYSGPISAKASGGTKTYYQSLGSAKDPTAAPRMSDGHIIIVKP